jgi:hypothetical protein
MFMWVLLAVVVGCWIIDRIRLKRAFQSEAQMRIKTEEQLRDLKSELKKTDELIADMRAMNFDIVEDNDANQDTGQTEGERE